MQLRYCRVLFGFTRATAAVTRLHEVDQHLISRERPEYGPRLVCKDAPVGAELVGHHDTRRGAHAEGDGENLFQ